MELNFVSLREEVFKLPTLKKPAMSTGTPNSNLRTKNAFFLIFKVLIALVLIGKILNWFLNFSDETNKALNVAMFSLIGIAYLVMGYVWDNKLTKTIIITCGAFLIAMNFFGKSVALDIIGIFCILTPLLIARFYKEKSHVKL
jgi:hypothetical protein